MPANSATRRPASAEVLVVERVEMPALRAGLIALLLVTLSVGVAWAVGTEQYLPSNDGAQHWLMAHVNRHYREHRWDETVVLNQPMTANGYPEIYNLVSRVAETSEKAHQVSVVVIVLIWGAAWTWFARKLQGSVVLAPLFFAASMQWLMWIGLLPFFLASSLIPVCLWLWRMPSRLIAGLAVAMTLVIQAQIHVFGAMLSGVILVVVEAESSSSWRRLLLLAFVGMPSAIYAVLLRSESAVMGSEIIWELDKNPVRLFTATFLPSDGFHAVFLAVGIATLIVLSIRAGRRQPRLGLVVVGVAFTFAGFLMPQKISGWEIVGARLQPTGVALLLCALPVEGWSSRARVAFLVAGVALFTQRIVWVKALNDRLRAEIAPPLAMLRAAPSMDGRYWASLVTHWYPEPTERRVEYLTSILHIGQAAAPNIGGIPEFSQAVDRTIHSILRPKLTAANRWVTPVTPPTFAEEIDSVFGGAMRQRVLEGQLAAMSGIEVIVGYGTEADVATAKSIGYDVDVFGRDDFEGVGYVATFRGCSIDIVLAGVPDEGIIDIGFGALKDVRITIDHAATDGVLHFDAVPCGPVWVRGIPGCGSTSVFGGRPYLADDGAELICQLPSSRTDRSHGREP